MNNLDLLIGDGKVYREVDYGGYDESKAGQMLQVWANAPAVLETARMQKEGETSYAVARRIVAILFEMPLENVQEFDDTKVAWLSSEGLDAYTEYHNALKKK